jgi:hypothetical protein
MVQDSGGGGGGDRRERFAYMQVPDFWDMVRYHDTAPHQQALQGWRQSYELVLMHRTQVEKYKEKLITAWPPKNSSAARAYVERLDHLIESLTETYNAAIANYSAYSAAIAAMDDAKRKLDAIHQEHLANAAALTKYEEEIRDRPRAYGKAIAPPPPPSPVAAGRQEELRLEAIKLVSGVSAELATAQFALTAPKPYTPSFAREDGTESLNSVGVSPVVPTGSSFPRRPPTSTNISRPTASGPSVRSAPSKPNTANQGHVPVAGKPSEGPILGGAKQPQSPPAVGTPSTPQALNPSIPTLDSPNLAPPAGPTSSTSIPRHPAMGSPSSGMLPPTTGSPSGTRGTTPPHGGLIGGTQPIGGAPTSRPGQGGSPTRGGTQRVNPIGGMIGQDGFARPAQRPATRRDSELNTRNWDPDNPWETESGIDPILLPRPEQRINPGPTIGGR